MEPGTPVTKRIAHCLFFPYRKRKTVFAVLILLLCAAGAIFLSANFTNDISRMLPDGSESAACYRKIATSSMFNKAMILFRANDPSEFRTGEFSQKMDRFLSLVLADKRILRADCKILPENFSESFRELLSAVPQFTPPELPAPGLLAENCRKQFLLPSSLGRAEMLAADPANLAGKLLLRLDKFRRISNFQVAPDSPYVTSHDGKHLLVLLETSVPATDPAEGKSLCALVHSSLERAGFGDEALEILPHRRAVANEAVVRKDIAAVSILTLVIFSLLTVFLYRCDLRSFLIPLIPFLSALLTAAMMPLVFRTPLYFVVGMGGIVISLAVDYGIHIYAVMTGNPAMRFRSLVRILPPFGVAAATSCAAFWLFLFSRTDAIRQLGFFSGTSLFLSLLLMLFLLPLALSGKKRIQAGISPNGRPLSDRHPRMIFAVFAVLFAGSILALPHLKFYSDVRQFDLSPPEYDRQEKSIPELFQNGQPPAMALFGGTDADDALEAVSKAETPEIFAASELMPPKREREKNLALWRNFVDSGKFDEYFTQLKAEADARGFDPEFFEPFRAALLSGIRNPASGAPKIFRPALDRLLVRGTDGNWNAAALFPDTEKNAEALRSLPGSTVISSSQFPKIMAQDIARGIIPLAIAAVFAVGLLTYLYFRSIRDTLLALLPVGLGLLFTAAFFAVIGKKVNIPVLTAGIILCGLAVDYGIFAVHAVRTGRERSIFRAVTLSALTTAAGGLTVAFAHHPMLRDAGQTIIVGIAFAYPAATLLLPAILRYGKKISGPKSVCLLLAGFALCLSACRTEPFEREKMPPLSEVIACADEPEPPPDTPFSFQGSVVFEYYPFFSMATICATHWDGKEFRIAALSPAGAKLFEIAGEPGKAREWSFLSGADFPKHPRETADEILSDFAHVFLDVRPYRKKTDADDEFRKDSILRREDGRVETEYAGRGLFPVRKKSAKKESGDWQSSYYGYIVRTGRGFPEKVVYDNFRRGYRLIFRIQEQEYDPQ